MLAWPSSTPIREIHRVGPEFPELAQRCVRLEIPIRVVTSAQNMGQPCEFRVSTLGRGWVHAAGLLLLSARLGPQETFLGPTNPVYDCINSDHPMENIPRPQITFLGRGRRIVHAGSYPNETPYADTVRRRPTATQARSPRPCAATGLESHAARGGQHLRVPGAADRPPLRRRWQDAVGRGPREPLLIDRAREHIEAARELSK